MKKQILSGFLAATIFSSCASAAFTDIKSDKLNQTVSVLNALKIMQGVSESTFSPDRAITRAEFSKLLVTMLGITDVTAYKSYTIFPDVPNTHWAAGYINAAIRHPDLQKKNIIKGYADGTFKPNNTINYCEACTMLLLALGYTIEDIGPMWPNDYVARVEALGLNPKDITLYANSAMSRENTAYMLLNALLTSGKEGTGKIIDTLVSGSDSEGAILIATNETDTDLRENQAKFYLNGEIITKNTEGTLDESMIGMRGTLYYSKQNTGSVIAILPEAGTRTESYKVSSVEADKIETSEGVTIKPSNETMVYLNGSVGKFGENWFNLLPNDEITLHYDSIGNITLIRTSARKISGNSFVYGTESDRPIPEGYKIVKNGYQIAREKLKQYDVITLEADTKTAKVSDTKLTGIYENAQPSYQNPSKITILGKEFNIPQNVASYFKTLGQSSKITVLLDSYGSIVAAYPASKVNATMVGTLQMGKDSQLQVKLLNGITISGTVSDESKNLIGQLVYVTQNKAGVLNVSKWSTGFKENGNWRIAENRIGNRVVSPNVTVWEQISENSPVTEVKVKNLPFDEIKQSDIRKTIVDNAGTIIGIILKDVSGDAWNYGFGQLIVGETTEDNTVPPLSAELRFYDYNSNAEKTLKYNLKYRPDGLNGQIIGLPKNAENNTEKQALDTITLKNIANVKLTDFDGSEGVRTASGYYKISDEVQVYVTGLNKFITLNQAKADYTNFTLYAERTANEGGKIRVIVVS